MTKQIDEYRIATAEDRESSSVCDDYSLLVGPDGFECYLGEPEDCRWYRDGARAVERLNEQHKEIERLKRIEAAARECAEDLVFGPSPQDRIEALRQAIGIPS